MSLQKSVQFYTFLIAIYVQQCSSVNLTTLRLVQVVFRHGDRAPLATYPTDPYSDFDKYWPNGQAQLTTLGKDQQYDLGLYLRGRYDGFIDRIYHKKQIHVLSSDTDRTLMSAEANLAGLFPKLAIVLKDSEESSDNKVDIQFVPIHTLMLQTDKLLHMSLVCPRRHAALEDYKNSSPFLQKLQRENQDLFKYVAKSTGLNFNDDIFSFTKIGDILFCQQQHNLTLPSWANETVMERMRYLSGIRFSESGGTAELRRLHGGPLAKRLMDNIRTTETTGDKKQPKMYMHSAHDDTLAALMNTLGVFHPQNPSYASMFIADLHQEESTGKYFVEIFYRNSTDHEPYPLRIVGCGSPCYLKHMQTLLAPYIPDNWETECQSGRPILSESESKVAYDNTLTAIIMGFLVVIFIAVIIWVIILNITSRRTKPRINETERPGYDKSSYINMH